MGEAIERRSFHLNDMLLFPVPGRTLVRGSDLLNSSATTICPYGSNTIVFFPFFFVFVVPPPVRAPFFSVFFSSTAACSLMSLVAAASASLLMKASGF